MTSLKVVPKIAKPEAEWRKALTPVQFYVTRQRGTEYAFTGPYWNEKRSGTYACVCCGAALFSNSIPEPVGRVFTRRFIPRSSPSTRTARGSCGGPKFDARSVMRTLVMYSVTGPSRPGCAIA